MAVFTKVANAAPMLIVATMGSSAVAASSLVEAFTFVWADAIPKTLTVICGARVGFHVGSGNIEAARRSTWLNLQVCLGCSLACALPCILWPKQLLSLMTSDAAVIELSSAVLAPMCLGTV